MLFFLEMVLPEGGGYFLSLVLECSELFQFGCPGLLEDVARFSTIFAQSTPLELARLFFDAAKILPAVPPNLEGGDAPVTSTHLGTI